MESKKFDDIVYGIRFNGDRGVSHCETLEEICDLAESEVDGLPVAVYRLAGVRTLRVGKPRLED